MGKDALRLSTVLAATPQVIYRAWLDSTQHAAFTHEPAKIDGNIGSKFSLRDGKITGRNMALEFGRRISQSWRNLDFPKTATDSRLEVLFESVGAGTRMTIMHVDLPEGSGDGLRAFWTESYFAPMTDYFGKFATILANTPPSQAVLPVDTDEEEEDDPPPVPKKKKKKIKVKAREDHDDDEFAFDHSETRDRGSKVKLRDRSDKPKKKKKTLVLPSEGKPAKATLKLEPVSTKKLEKAEKPKAKVEKPVKAEKAEKAKPAKAKKAEKPAKAKAKAKPEKAKAKAKPATKAKKAEKPAKAKAKPAKAKKAEKPAKAKPAKAKKAEKPAKAKAKPVKKKKKR